MVEKKPGDYIEQYDVLCELITEKVTVEMPSPVEGTLVRLLVDNGATALSVRRFALLRSQRQPAQREAQHLRKVKRL